MIYEHLEYIEVIEAQVEREIEEAEFEMALRNQGYLIALQGVGQFLNHHQRGV